jgi:LEA14-like dessication related protein
LRLIFRMVFLAITVVQVACDPGMTVHQLKSSDEVQSDMVVRIKTTRQLIGETWYAPEIEVTNPNKSPITVTNVELAARSKTYANVPFHPETYPLTIQPGNTKTLDVMFRLDDAVYKTFKQAAELSVHFRSGEKQETVRVSVIRGRL